ncbi:MAG: hypothetical protein ACJ749_14460 [Flavisolibacter sp.]
MNFAVRLAGLGVSGTGAATGIDLNVDSFLQLRNRMKKRVAIHFLWRKKLFLMKKDLKYISRSNECGDRI